MARVNLRAPTVRERVELACGTRRDRPQVEVRRDAPRAESLRETAFRAVEAACERCGKHRPARELCRVAYLDYSIVISLKLYAARYHDRPDACKKANNAKNIDINPINQYRPARTCIQWSVDCIQCHEGPGDRESDQRIWIS